MLKTISNKTDFKLNVNPFSQVKNPYRIYTSLIRIEDGQDCVCMTEDDLKNEFINKLYVSNGAHYYGRDFFDVFIGNKTLCITFKGRWFMHTMKEYLENKI